MIFVPKYVSRVVFKGRILGDARQFWGNPQYFIINKNNNKEKFLIERTPPSFIRTLQTFPKWFKDLSRSS